MINNKKIKEELRKKGFKEPEKYYPTDAFKELGYIKNECKNCKRIFYAVESKNICGDPACFGGFKFIGCTPAKNKLDYIQAWTKFADIMKKQGYTPIKRYPCVARWREDEYWVGASIYDFQPYVVSGEVEPPANPLVVPQFCMRFNDIDNIGITGAHYACFIMQGQHAFVEANHYDKNRYFKDLHNWFSEGIGLRKEELYIHLDSWAGGGNAGVSCEFMSRGLEIANQVYMTYEATPSGLKDLKTKVLDMGQGQERVAWFTQGSSTSYETTFPTVMKKLYSATGIKVDDSFMQKFLPYSSYLNIDEVEDIDKVWSYVAKKVELDVKVLKEKILELAALYSIAEHSRALLVALSDGALPSNVGGGYNLRAILRRALSFIDKHKWNIYLPDVCRWHAEYLKPLFPELSENIDEVKKILEVEKSKYEATKQKTHSMISKLVKEEINEKKLLILYDSYGITPELVREEALKLDTKISIPENFYAKIAEMHEKHEQEHATVKKEKLDLEGLPETKALYFSDYRIINFKAKVLKITDNKVILDQTYFYPTSGGQLFDTGEINKEKVIDVFKQGSIIVHVMTQKPRFKIRDMVNGKIDWERRQQLAQHHTSTHIMTYAARKVLGRHINQASAKKTIEKGQLDITHYQSLSDEELEKIEEEANKVVNEKISLSLSFMPRNEAEQKYGMGIYQGGVVPGKNIRIVNINGVDVEACGGTHLNNTAEVGEIRILKAVKISDGVVRITFTAGGAAKKTKSQEQEILQETARILDCNIEQLPGRLEELFRKWKDIVKKDKKVDKFVLTSKEEYKGDILAKCSEILRTQKEYIPKTVQRFITEIKEKIGK